MGWFAWSNITTSKDAAGRPRRIPVGEEVTPQSMGLTGKQFQELIDTRAVRAEPYPAIAHGSTVSPSEYFRRQLAVAEGRSDANVMDDAQIVRINDGLQVPGLIAPDPVGEPQAGTQGTEFQPEATAVV